MPARILTAIIAAGLLAIPVGDARAQGAPPAPGCYGSFATDPAGDSANALEPSQTGSPSSDLIGAFNTYDAAAHKGFVNIQVDNLTAGEVDPPYVGISWEYQFSTAAGARFVRAYQDIAGVVRYSWGEPRAITDDQTAPRVSGATTGALFPGKGGIVQIELPLGEADFGAKPGTQLKSQALEVRQWISLPASVPSTGLPLFSPAPVYDTATGKGAFTFGPCPAPAAPAAPVTPTAPTAPAAPQAGTFDVKVTIPKLRARSLARRKRFTVKLRGTGSNLVLVVRKSLTRGRNLATGRLKRLKGSRKVTLRTRGRLKKGTYYLLMSGKNAAGQPAEGGVRFRVR